MSSNTIKKTISGALAISAEKSKSAASASLQLATEGSKKTTQWAAANPRMALTIGAGAALVVAPMTLAAPVLGAVGFGAQGVVAGTWGFCHALVHKHADIQLHESISIFTMRY